MFTPTRGEVRRFFIDTWRKHRAGEVLAPIEALALDWIEQHPEYHALLEDPDEALGRDFPPEAGQENPFLHLSLHVALTEQLSIDQPPGIRGVFGRLAAQHDDLHKAAHVAIDCLAEIVWRMQKGAAPADPTRLNAEYLEALTRRVRAN
jgi:Domain of unknown function (DUF1841)